jgi:nicotinate-nucleotide adenylyltransferase
MHLVKKNNSGIGILGGTFDPIHDGHVRLACALRDELLLSEVRFIPAGQPYHRKMAPQATPLQRLTMVKLAIGNEPGLVVDEREIKQITPAYTVETLNAIRQEVGWQKALWYLMGMDAFSQLSTWKKWQDLLKFANIAIAMRGTDQIMLPNELMLLWNKRTIHILPEAISGTIYCLKLLPQSISSSHLRQMLSTRKNVQLPICQAVLQYITQASIY